jgi:hypothetical protein
MKGKCYRCKKYIVKSVKRYNYNKHRESKGRHYINGKSFGAGGKISRTQKSKVKEHKYQPRADYRQLNARILGTWKEQGQQAQIYLH